MNDRTLSLLRQMVAAYLDGESGTYAETAQLFGVGEATLSRALRRHRERGDVEYRPRGGNNPRRVDLKWLLGHAQANPDALLRERVDAWEKHSGQRVHITTMWSAMQALGWTHKKNSSRSRKRATRRRTSS